MSGINVANFGLVDRTFIRWVFSLAFCGPLWAAPEKPPILYDITPMLRADSQAIELVGGKKIPLPNIAFDALRFIDDFPNANWEHPARFQFTNKGQVVLEVPTRLPPKGLKRQYRLGPPSMDEAPVFNLSDFGGKYRIQTPANYFAVLLNGNGDERHWNDFSFLFRVLVNVYGYLPQNIFVADSNFRGSKPDLDGNGIPDIHYGSTIGDIEAVFATVSQQMLSTDQLLLVVNDHGSINNGESTLILADGELTASQFAQLLKAVPAQRVLSIFEQCFSGGFVRPTVSPQRVSMAASTDKEISWASEDGVFDEFLYLVISAFAHQRHDGTLVSADLNADARVTAREAFSHAISYDSTRENPFMEAHKNSLAAFTIGLD